MGEGLARQIADGRFQVKSAGVTPIGVHPAAIASMREIGIDISDQTSDLLTGELLEWTDFVITLCNQARDHCPAIPPGVRHIHWDIPNPDQLYLSPEDRNRQFAAVRDLIKERIETLFKEIK